MIAVNTILPLRNNLIYCRSVKIPYLVIQWTLGKHFCLLLVLEAFSLKKIVKMLEEVVVSSQEVRCICQIRENILAQFVQLWKNWLYDVQSGVSVENWAISRDLCWPQVLQVSLHLINLLSILLRCNGFIGIQKAVVDETGSRLPNNDHDLFWFKFGFGKWFGASSQSNHQPSHHQLDNIHS